MKMIRNQALNKTVGPGFGKYLPEPFYKRIRVLIIIEYPATSDPQDDKVEQRTRGVYPSFTWHRLSSKENLLQN